MKLILLKNILKKSQLKNLRTFSKNIRNKNLIPLNLKMSLKSLSGQKNKFKFLTKNLKLKDMRLFTEDSCKIKLIQL